MSQFLIQQSPCSRLGVRGEWIILVGCVFFIAYCILNSYIMFTRDDFVFSDILIPKGGFFCFKTGPYQVDLAVLYVVNSSDRTLVYVITFQETRLTDCFQLHIIPLLFLCDFCFFYLFRTYFCCYEF